MAIRLSRTCRVWVLTQGHDHRLIEDYLASHPLPNLHIVYYDIPLISKLTDLLAKNFFLRSYVTGLHYYLWQLAIYSVVKKLHKQIDFDLTHHNSYARYWMPSLLCLLPVPFIFGSVGGADTAPASLKKNAPLRAKLFEALRDFMVKMADFDPLVRMTARRSSVALATTPATMSKLREYGARNIKLVFDAGIEDEQINIKESIDVHKVPPVRLISVGRLIHWKGYHLSLQAFAMCRDLEMEYWLYGQGEEYLRLQKLCRELNILDRVHFMGFVPREDVLNAFNTADIFIHPSMHETGGQAVLEAMAAGLPVICLDLGGPAVSVSEEVGIKVPAREQSQVVTEMAIALRSLALDPSRRSGMGRAAAQRARDTFTWDKKNEEMLNIYALAIDGKPNSSQTQ